MSEDTKPRKAPTDKAILFFILALCFGAALLLAVVSYSLSDRQNQAKQFDQEKQLLISAKILNHAGHFELLQEDGSIVPARFDASQNILVPIEGIPPKASAEEIEKIAALRIRPLLTDEQGKIHTIEAKNIDLPSYLSENKKTGYATLPFKLFYAILPNSKESEQLKATDVAAAPEKISTVVIPVSGFGLWAPIYGFLAVSVDGDTVIGTTWYEHAETPGLGANITEPWWQKQFYGKLIFQKSADGKTDFTTASMGIIVVKGKVKDVYGTSARAQNAVDGMSGATLTGDGVTMAYRNSLNPYRAFLILLHGLKEGKPEKKDGARNAAT